MHYGLTLTKRTTISIVTASAFIAIVIIPGLGKGAISFTEWVHVGHRCYNTSPK